jgi:hypothetical protein
MVKATLQFEQGFSDASEGYPRIASFPSGAPKSEMEIIVGSKGSGKKRKNLVISELDGVDYKAQDYGNVDTHKNNLCKYAIGKLDSNTGKMMIYPTSHIYILRPDINKVSLLPPFHNNILNNDDKRNKLTFEFGSRKKQKALSQAQSNKIIDDNIIGANTVKANIMSSMSLSDSNTNNNSSSNNDLVSHLDASEYALEQNRKLLLPPYNGTTTVFEEAYPLCVDADVDADADADTNINTNSHKTLMPGNIYNNLLVYYESLLPLQAQTNSDDGVSGNGNGSGSGNGNGADIEKIKTKNYISVCGSHILSQLNIASIEMKKQAQAQAQAQTQAQSSQEASTDSMDIELTEAPPPATITAITSDNSTQLTTSKFTFINKIYNYVTTHINYAIVNLTNSNSKSDKNKNKNKINKNIFIKRVISLLYMNTLLNLYKLLSTCRVYYPNDTITASNTNTNTSGRISNKIEKDTLICLLSNSNNIDEVSYDNSIMFDTIMKLFSVSKTVKGGLKIYEWNKISLDKLLSYILAVGLHGGSGSGSGSGTGSDSCYTVILDTLANEMTIPKDNLIKISRSMGGKLSSEKVTIGSTSSTSSAAAPAPAPVVIATGDDEDDENDEDDKEMETSKSIASASASASGPSLTIMRLILPLKFPGRPRAQKKKR